mmetsp:Transcript_125550/g.250474  ORF Transcript_125550/g.250474 Transcript_125550/m.250474 type:complete len:215 (+) Transcript_125550:84-728(+)
MWQTVWSASGAACSLQATFLFVEFKSRHHRIHMVRVVSKKWNLVSHQGLCLHTPRGFSSVESPALSGFGVITSGMTLSQSPVSTSQQGLKMPFVVRSRCQQVPHQPSMQPYFRSLPAAISAAAERRELRRTVHMYPSGIMTILIGPFLVLRIRVNVTSGPSFPIISPTILSMSPSSVSTPLTAMILSPSRTHMPAPGSSSTQTLRLTLSVLPFG